jgi:molybdenum cofactor cytidylyltransferase
LLMEIASRPMPRALATRHLAGDHVVGILLAAGQSRRMGAINKLLAPLAGKPLVRHATEAMLASELDEVIVVVGHEADKVAAALDGLPVRLVFNAHHASGQASSVATGIGALAADVSDVIIGLGDMPLLTAAMIDRLLRAHLDQADHHRRITMPLVGSKRGNPVVWGRAFLPELAALSGDSGGRQLLDDHIAAHNPVMSDDAAWLQDVDTVDALAALDQ